jgi:hypothetical protein
LVKKVLAITAALFAIVWGVLEQWSLLDAISQRLREVGPVGILLANLLNSHLLPIALGIVALVLASERIYEYKKDTKPRSKEQQLAADTRALADKILAYLDERRRTRPVISANAKGHPNASMFNLQMQIHNGETVSLYAARHARSLNSLIDRMVECGVSDAQLTAVRQPITIVPQIDILCSELEAIAERLSL